ncbi:hypothetical protein CTAM01_05711 [Colletotrichum tamarilloi]|uniref:Uncharacterized protein n=1 Tax=Colletotrichum tamarilloi TaxID=1209934 RepID=A0ABQ9RDG8_9PEZI|nr:uncharacterized protein CTAM01_05711 [Colletotrichum tamarilloi]KAI3540495.1 hypothetical protein CSPX01_08157 [Colletotrichum filicis]KAK1501487.1 hypothetical protein CTAM01_05711 [Colletotrichum tamarilloi]
MNGTTEPCISPARVVQYRYFVYHQCNSTVQHMRTHALNTH